MPRTHRPSWHHAVSIPAVLKWCRQAIRRPCGAGVAPEAMLVKPCRAAPPTRIVARSVCDWRVAGQSEDASYHSCQRWMNASWTCQIASTSRPAKSVKCAVVLPSLASHPWLAAWPTTLIQRKSWTGACLSARSCAVTDPCRHRRATSTMAWQSSAHQVTLAVPWGPVAVGARRTIVWHHPWNLQAAKQWCLVLCRYSSTHV
mmetsp:Transcript_4404/g.9450  ORF Transcript_4404/g.9450 Transcript_4404/m.9450 type:complete len:202 (+) Transcript_4404:539-1144(+)